MENKVLKTNRRQRGFTILEITVVLALIAVIMGIVGPRILAQLDKSKPRVAKIQIQTLRGAIDGLRLDIGRYPSTQEGLAMLVTKPTDPLLAAKWRGPYLEAELPIDPWDKPYQYALGGQNSQAFALYSYGLDGKRGGEGDDADIGVLPAAAPDAATGNK
jgi:general secretion pathway protein G